MEQEKQNHKSGYIRLPELFIKTCVECSPSYVVCHTYGDHACHDLANYLKKRLGFNIQYINKDEEGNAVFYFSDKTKKSKGHAQTSSVKQ